MSEQSDFSRTFRHAKPVLAGVVMISLLFYVASGLYVVEPEQRGVVIRFGKVVSDDVMPGIHYHWPWPVERVQRPRTTAVRSISIPFRNSTIKKKGSALYSGELLTGDENLVQATLQIQYSISNPKDYLTNTADPDAVLKRLIHSSSIQHFAAMSVDDVLTTGREKIQGRLKANIQRMSDNYKLGVRLTSVQLQNIEPPSTNGVANAFKSVASAREDKQKQVEEAAGERNRRLPKSRADAESLLRDAEAYTKEIVERAQGDSKRFLAVWREYNKAKSITAYRLYLEAVEKIMPRVEKLIVNPNAEETAPILTQDSVQPGRSQVSEPIQWQSNPYYQRFGSGL